MSQESRKTLRLTPQNVKSLPPASSGYRDTLVGGLTLRVWPSGARSFALEYSRRGRTRRYTIGNVSLAEARKKAQQLRSEVLAGRDPQAEKSQAQHRAITVKDLTNQCLAALELREATADEYRRLADVEIIPAIGQRAAAELTRGEIRTLFRKIAKRAPYIANRAFGVLRRVYSWAAVEDLIIGTPFVGLPAPASEHASDRVLTTAELRALLLALDTLPGQRSDAVLLLLLTGARREMVVGLRSAELELDGQEPRWTIPAERMKAGRPHVVPLSKAAVDVLERRKATAVEGALFPPAHGKAPSMWWASRYVRKLRAATEAQYRKLAKLPDDAPEAVPRWTIHSLRHSMATHLREDLRVPSEVVAAILAHAPPGSAVSRVYNRAELLPERRAALVAWAAWLSATKEGRRGNVLAHTRA